ncbi:MAG: hypothetical protein ABH829_00520 [archaeon]
MDPITVGLLIAVFGGVAYVVSRGGGVKKEVTQIGGAETAKDFFNLLGKAAGKGKDRALKAADKVGEKLSHGTIKEYIGSITERLGDAEKRIGAFGKELKMEGEITKEETEEEAKVAENEPDKAEKETKKTAKIFSSLREKNEKEIFNVVEDIVFFAAIIDPFRVKKEKDFDVEEWSTICTDGTPDDDIEAVRNSLVDILSLPLANTDAVMNAATAVPLEKGARVLKETATLEEWASNVVGTFKSEHGATPNLEPIAKEMHKLRKEYHGWLKEMRHHAKEADGWLKKWEGIFLKYFKEEAEKKAEGLEKARLGKRAAQWGSVALAKRKLGKNPSELVAITNAACESMKEIITFYNSLGMFYEELKANKDLINKLAEIEIELLRREGEEETAKKAEGESPKEAEKDTKKEQKEEAAETVEEETVEDQEQKERDEIARRQQEAQNKKKAERQIRKKSRKKAGKGGTSKKEGGENAIQAPPPEKTAPAAASTPSPPAPSGP